MTYESEESEWILHIYSPNSAYFRKVDILNDEDEMTIIKIIILYFIDTFKQINIKLMGM